jgi:hypothetical protein
MLVPVLIASAACLAMTVGILFLLRIGRGWLSVDSYWVFAAAAVILPTRGADAAAFVSLPLNLEVASVAFARNRSRGARRFAPLIYPNLSRMSYEGEGIVLCPDGSAAAHYYCDSKHIPHTAGEIARHP